MQGPPAQDNLDNPEKAFKIVIWLDKFKKKELFGKKKNSAHLIWRMKEEDFVLKNKKTSGFGVVAPQFATQSLYKEWLHNKYFKVLE